MAKRRALLYAVLGAAGGRGKFLRIGFRERESWSMRMYQRRAEYIWFRFVVTLFLNDMYRAFCRTLEEPRCMVLMRYFYYLRVDFSQLVRGGKNIDSFKAFL